jgi:hypothetical protein
MLAAVGVQPKQPTRFVIPAGSAPGLTWEHALGLPFEMWVMRLSDALQQPVQGTSSVYPSQRLAAIRGWYRPR